ncbi:MAG: hypothetical protein JW966_03550 [Anaerolineae bacterium]|nr:hypothetical protein [Anaerolineae bacterium]
MDDSTNEQRPRASLRGRGREILLGQQTTDSEKTGPAEDIQPAAEALPEAPASEPVNASSLALTPEETEALLDFSPASPAYDVEDVPSSEAVPEHISGGDSLVPEDTAGYPDALPLAERSEAQLAAMDDVLYLEDPAIDDLVPSEPELWRKPPEEPVSNVRPAVDTTADTQPDKTAPTSEHEGGLVAPEGAPTYPAPARGIADPFTPTLKRQPSADLFDDTGQPDAEMLKALVDDERLQALWRQIDDLHEELVQTVKGDRGSTDVFQQELLQASSLLLESRANYDDARAIVYRIRADINRLRKVEADIMRYRPLMLNYYIGWGIALVVLGLLKELFAGVAESVGVDVVSALYYPMLFGIAGALISGYITLDRHTNQLRDFDPIHTSWYLFNPLLGGMMGLLMFLLASIANEDLLKENASGAELAIALLLCVVAGMNQNTVLQQLNDMLKRFGGSRNS